jgi:hypothetical protein
LAKAVAAPPHDSARFVASGDADLRLREIEWRQLTCWVMPQLDADAGPLQRPGRTDEIARGVLLSAMIEQLHGHPPRVSEDQRVIANAI